MILIKIVIVLAILFFVFVAWLVTDLPDYMGDGNYGGTGKVTVTTKVKSNDSKMVVKTRVKSTKEKLDRFEEEAFWMNVFDDSDGF